MELGSSGIFTITFKFEEHAMTSDVILRVLRTPGKFDSDAGRVDGPQHNEVSMHGHFRRDAVTATSGKDAGIHVKPSTNSVHED